MPKHNKPSFLGKKYKEDNRSTKDTFIQWLTECGNDLMSYSGVLSCCGSDGPSIKENKVGNAHYNKPEEIENFLIEYGYYEKQTVMLSVPYTPPSVHYLEWFNKKFN